MTEVAMAADTTEAVEPDSVKKVQAADAAKPDETEPTNTESKEESVEADAAIDKENDATSVNNAKESVQSANDDTDAADAAESADNQKVSDEKEIEAPAEQTADPKPKDADVEAQEAVDEKPSDAEPKDKASDGASFEATYTKELLIKDISELIVWNVDGTKAIRKKLRKRYKLGGKPFKDYEPFKAALQHVIDNGGEDADEDGDVEIDEPRKSKKSKKSKDKKKKKSRKRKKPSSDHEDADAAEDDDAHKDSEPSKKKRKMNSGASVDADDDADADDEEEEEDVDVDKKKPKKEKAKKAKRKKAPKYTKLDKLKQLLRATRQATPMVYAELKELKNDTARVKMCLALLAEKDVPTNDLSVRGIQRVKDEWALKHEMAELGLGNRDDLECEDGVPLSTRRPRRKRKEVSYLTPKLELDSDNSDAEEDEAAEPEEEEEEEESEEYQPPEMSDDE